MLCGVISGHGEHANLAGKKPLLCIMIVAEGMSAADYCDALASIAKLTIDGNNYIDIGKDVCGFIDL